MASGIINGYTNNKYIDSKVEWSATPNYEKNESSFTASLYYRRNNSYSGTPTSGFGTFVLEIDGDRKSKEVNLTIPNGGAWVKAFSVTKSIAHESNGEKRVNIFALGDIPIAEFHSSYIGLAYLDVIDNSPPTIIENSVSITNITQKTADVSFSTNDALDKIEYDIGNGYVEVNSNQFQITGLSPFVDYELSLRIRKANNKKTSEFGFFLFKTLPIYITDFTIPEVVNIDLGKEYVVEPIYVPENASIKTLSFSTSDKNIVVVENNRLIAKNKGTAIITAKTIDGSDIIKRMSVNVKVRVNGIVAEPKNLTLAKGSSIPIYYTVLPENADNKNVSLFSSDEEILTVSGTTINALENGEVTITIITEDGEYSTEILVNVVEQYTWYNYPSPIKILNSEDIEHIVSNINTIRTMLLASGYSIDTLNIVENAKNLQLYLMLENLQNIEYNLNIISSTDVKSIYYIEPKTIGEYAPNEQDIWRWIQVLNEMYNILTGEFGKWQILLCKDGYPIINEKNILIRGDKIG